MIYPGLVSVTFRKLTPQGIVELVKRAGLVGIEWGGDIHVPHGNLDRAREVARMTEDAGLRAAAYGSYYRVAKEDQPSFELVADTAVALGAPLIRVWAGDRGFAEADEAYRRLVVEESRKMGDIAAARGLEIAYEFHGHTLTDTNESAKWLLEQVSHPAVKAYWQPPVGRDTEYCLEGLNFMLPWLTNVHVFTWEGNPPERRALSEGTERWLKYLHQITGTGRDHGALIEFVREDQPEAFLEDAAALREWLNELQ